ncbi:MAG: tetratricopeptide repeat protein [Chthoniobacteraceae bacterium]|jgi:TolA-binding protein
MKNSKFEVLSFLCLTALLAPCGLHAQSPSPLADAEAALDSHLPEVAIVKLHSFLASSAASDDALREQAESDLTRALLDSGDADGALARLEFPASEREEFWKAEALSALGRWDDAEPLYEELANDGPSDLLEAATIGQAEALHAMGRTREAESALAALEERSPSAMAGLRLAELYLETQQLQKARELLDRSPAANLVEARWRQYVEGRIFLAEDQAAPALQDFEELLKDPAGLTPALHAGATIGLTEARIVLNGLEVADNVIEDYIWHNPDSPYLEEMFRRLDRIYAAEENPSDSEIEHWTAQPPARRAALARYYQARSLQRQGRQEKAVRAYTEFVQQYPHHQFAFDAWMQLGLLYLDTGRIPIAVSAFEGAMRTSTDPGQRARAEIATGNADFAQREFLHAAENFDDAASRSSDYWLEATYDSALAWLNLQNYNRFLADYNSISDRYPGDDRQQQLLLEEGLFQARSGDPRAAASLQSFIRDFPDNHRIAEARLALAELVFADGDASAAGDLLHAAYVSEPSNDSREHADYLAIFVADSAPDREDDKILSLGLQFLDRYPASPLRPQVRMKLGQVYFRREDYADAQTQFETLADENPSDPLTDKALILAGQSAVRTMNPEGATHALELFDRVANGSGPLKLYARQEEALLYAHMGRDNDAVIVYDEILRSNPDTELRLAALCGKADCLVASINDAASPAPSPAPVTSSTNSYAAAIALYDQIATDPDATPPWRDQALYKKGRCLNKQGLTDDALAAYYDVLKAHSAAAKQQQPDFFWFEKAGYAAAQALEDKSQWPGAISILEKIAQAGGPRSDEARKRADELRLQHFIWD